ncbi:MAG TPA: YabP/YqfC family sporulation protein [Bacillota bacterium]|nr:YabP/YqfC family sporulation protein [Bacillota bacterium]
MTQQPGSAKPAGGHRLVLDSREQCTVSGVLRVASFDDKTIVLETDYGALTLEGTELQIQQLDLDAGTFAVQGVVTSATYSTGGLQGRGGARSRRRGMGRLFR